MRKIVELFTGDFPASHVVINWLPEGSTKSSDIFELPNWLEEPIIEYSKTTIFELKNTSFYAIPFDLKLW